MYPPIDYYSDLNELLTATENDSAYDEFRGTPKFLKSSISINLGKQFGSSQNL